MRLKSEASSLKSEALSAVTVVLQARVPVDRFWRCICEFKHFRTAIDRIKERRSRILASPSIIHDIEFLNGLVVSDYLT